MTVTHGPMMPPPAAVPGPPPAGWPMPAPPAPSAPQHRGWIAAVGVAIVLSIAALGIGIAALVRPAQTLPMPGSTSHEMRAKGGDEANRAFCTDIAPLMGESDKSAQAFSHLDKNAPDFKQAGQPFVETTKAWVGRIQPVIDSHGDADPFLIRSTQRFVDDLRYLIDDLQAGDGPEWLPYDQTIWNDSVAAVSGTARNCFDLGVKW